MLAKYELVTRLRLMTVTTRTSIPPTAVALASVRRVAVVGGGASGAMTALNILRTAPECVTVTVYEASGEVGCGLAYATTDRRHLLNVPACNMSAFPDAPGDLLEWAAETGRELGPTDFLPRADYAIYLRDRLQAISGRCPGRLTTVTDAVVDIVPRQGRFDVRSRRGPQEAYDAVVLAYGNATPSRLAIGGEPLPSAPWHVANPWELSWVHGLAEDATVVLVGSGLTAVDMAITVLDDAPARRAVMVSRHGLLPEAHLAAPSRASSAGWTTPIPGGPLTADGLAELVTRQLWAAEDQGVDWRLVIDGLREPTQSIWARLDLEERRRFLERYARLWEVRRHRMAPGVAALVEGYRASGRLAVTAGGLRGVIDATERACVDLGARSLVADAVVNCTGPLGDVERTADPLLTALLGRGLIVPDDLHLGLACTPAGEVLDAQGRAVPGLFTVGPPRKGVLYETTAVPEIRVQALEVAGLVHVGG